MDKEILNKIIELRHKLHRMPDLSSEEGPTKEFLINYLKENSQLKIVDKGKFFYAIYEGDKASNFTLAIRAEMDALPINESPNFKPYSSLKAGISHKCGHDGHAAALIGFGLELERLKSMGKAIKCRCILLFQHAEETGLGGPECLELLRDEKIDRIYAIHNFPGLEKSAMAIDKGPVQPASQGLIIKLKGRNSHASNPEKGLNPYPAVARTLLSLEEIEKDGRWKGFVRITVVGVKVGDGAFGVNPGYGELRLTIRAEHEEEMLRLKNMILDKAKEEAMGMGLGIASEDCEYFPEEKNDAKAVNIAIKACENAGIKVSKLPEPDRASDDFGAYLKEIPGAMCFMGLGEHPPIHTIDYDFDDDVIEAMVDFYIELMKLHENS